MEKVLFRYMSSQRVKTQWKTGSCFGKTAGQGLDRFSLKHWRGIYFIYDASDGKGYVGSAYGKDNIMGRWLNYAASGHGGNKRLLKRAPGNFRFSILQIVAHDLNSAEVVAIENTWKKRLHTQEPSGLNNN